MIHLINSAFAQEIIPTVAKQPSPWTSMLPLVLIMVVFYFLLIRPQQKKLKDHQLLIKAVGVGDEIITNGGMFGEVVRIEDDKSIIHLLIAEGVKIRIRQDMIAEVIKSVKNPVITEGNTLEPIKKVKLKKRK